jgi:hypothetical protein
MKKCHVLLWVLVVMTGSLSFAQRNHSIICSEKESGLIPPTELTVAHLGLGVVHLNWEFDPADDFQYFRIYRNGSLIDSLTEISYLDSLSVYSIYTYEVTAFYDEGESQPAGPVEIEWIALPIIEVNPMEFNENHPCAPMTITQTLTISNVGEVPLDWELAFDDSITFPKIHGSNSQIKHAKSEEKQKDTLENDVGIINFINPVNNLNLSYAEPVIVTIENFGTNTQTEIPVHVSWTGPTGVGSVTETWTGYLTSGETTDYEFDATVNMYLFGPYSFNAKTLLAGDQNTQNDSTFRYATNIEGSLATWELYSTGCSFGDGLIYWDLESVNIPEIPCEGNPPYYHDYTDHVHKLAPGETYTLTVQAGYDQTYFDVWIKFNDELNMCDGDLVLNDGYCEQANQDYEFEITIPDTALPGFYIMRYRTNWIDPVWGDCEKYSYGNACDFTACISDDVQWLEADTLSGIIEPWESQEVTLTFNSEGLDPGSYLTNLVIQNFDPLNPVLEIPVQLEVQEAEITYSWEPEFFEFQFFITKDFEIDYLTVENTGTDTLLVDFEIEYIEPVEDEWLSINPPSAEIHAGEEQIFEVAADPSYLYGYHGEANLIMNTSDVCFPSQTIPVTVDIIGAVDEIEKAKIKIFPNPANDLLNITSDVDIETVILQNHFGQIIRKVDGS